MVTDQDGTVSYISPSVERALGYTPGEMVGTNSADYVHPDDLGRAFGELATLLSKAGVHPVAVETRVRHKDGSWRHLEGMATNLLDDPAVEGLVFNHRDVTDRVRAEEEVRRLNEELEARVAERTARLEIALSELRESEERFRATFEQAAVGVAHVSIDGRLLRVNDKLCEIFGYAQEGMLRLTLQDLTHPDEHDADLAYVRRLLAGEIESYSMEKRYFRKDGSLIWTNLAVSLVRDSSGDPEYFIGAIEDVTERKRAEEALKESEERFRATFEQAAVGVAHVGPDGRWLRVNDKLCEITGYPREELSRMTFQDITHIDDLQRDLEYLDRLLTGEITSYSTEKRYVRKNGSDVWIHLTVSAVGDLSGRLKYFITNIVDITERKEAEEALIQSEERYRAVVEQSTEGLYLVEGDTRRILETNPALQNMLGYTAAELRGMELHEIVAHDREDVEANVRRTLKEGTRFIRERKYRRKDGSVVEVEIAASAIDYGGKRVICAAIRDITERKKAEEEIRRFNEELEERVRSRTAQLRAANEELKTFGYSVSHDLRAPLRSMVGFSQVLLEDYGGELDETGKDYLRRIRDAGERMGDLIDDILHLSSVSRREMRREEVDLSALARRVAEALRREKPGRRARFIIADRLSTLGDAGLLEVALENLLGNAWKFTSKEPEALIEVGALERGGEPVYYVRDNGVGFDEAYVDKIFGPFQRLHGEDQFEGTGVGLATVTRIVRRHGGSLWAEGEVGQGATFYFTL